MSSTFLHQFIDTVNVMDFRERLRDEIEYKGLSVKELAANVGISYSTFLSYIDARGVLPNVETAVKISKILGVSVEYLVTGNLKKKNNESSLPTDFQTYTEKMSKLNPTKRKIFFELIDSLIEEKKFPYCYLN